MSLDSRLLDGLEGVLHPDQLKSENPFFAKSLCVSEKRLAEKLSTKSWNRIGGDREDRSNEE